MRHLIFLLLFVSMTVFTSEASAAEAVKAWFGCAPWDGGTFELIVSSQGMTTNIKLWGDGLNQIQNGTKTIAIESKDSLMDPHAIGHAEQCKDDASNSCQPSSLTIEFTTLELKINGTIQGYIHNSHSVDIPFKGQLSPAQGPCG